MQLPKSPLHLFSQNDFSRPVIRNALSYKSKPVHKPFPPQDNVLYCADSPKLISWKMRNRVNRWGLCSERQNVSQFSTKTTDELTLKAKCGWRAVNNTFVVGLFLRIHLLPHSCDLSYSQDLGSGFWLKSTKNTGSTAGGQERDRVGQEEEQRVVSSLCQPEKNVFPPGHSQ